MCKGSGLSPWFVLFKHSHENTPCCCRHPQLSGVIPHQVHTLTLVCTVLRWKGWTVGFTAACCNFRASRLGQSLVEMLWEQFHERFMLDRRVICVKWASGENRDRCVSLHASTGIAYGIVSSVIGRAGLSFHQAALLSHQERWNPTFLHSALFFPPSLQASLMKWKAKRLAQSARSGSFYWLVFYVFVYLFKRTWNLLSLRCT